MFENKLPREKNGHGFKAQAIVEFAIVLPILLVLLVGILEVGRYIFMYSAMTNASRNASRYASAVGRDDNGLTKYNYCEGIKQIALRSAYLINPSDITVEITYDNGAGTQISVCNLWNASQVDGDVVVKTGDRVKVRVTVQYEPMVDLVPIEGRLIESESARTILGIIDLDH